MCVSAPLLSSAKALQRRLIPFSLLSPYLPSHYHFFILLLLLFLQTRSLSAFLSLLFFSFFFHPKSAAHLRCGIRIPSSLWLLWDLNINHQVGIRSLCPHLVRVLLCFSVRLNKEARLDCSVLGADCVLHPVGNHGNPESLADTPAGENESELSRELFVSNQPTCLATTVIFTFYYQRYFLATLLSAKQNCFRSITIFKPYFSVLAAAEPEDSCCLCENIIQNHVPALFWGKWYWNYIVTHPWWGK